MNVNIHHTANFSGLFNSYGGVQLAWDLGNGWGFSYLLGGYIPVNSSVAFSSGSLNQRFALSYTADGWDLTANTIWGIQFNQVTDHPQVSPCPVSLAFPHNGCNPNFLNVDLTATKRFGKWELGPVGFYSTDLSTPVPAYQKQSQFALGGLIGYYFDRVNCASVRYKRRVREELRWVRGPRIVSHRHSTWESWRWSVSASHTRRTMNIVDPANPNQNYGDALLR